MVACNRVVPAVLRHCIYMHESCALGMLAGYAYLTYFFVCPAVVFCHANTLYCDYCKWNMCKDSFHTLQMLYCFVCHPFTLLDILTILGTICLPLTCLQVLGKASQTKLCVFQTHALCSVCFCSVKVNQCS